MAGFRWESSNVGHIARHGITPGEAEFVILHARRPFPSYEGDGRWLARGQNSVGAYIQVVYVLDEDGTLYVIHARQLTGAEKRQLRRRRK